MRIFIASRGERVPNYWNIWQSGLQFFSNIQDIFYINDFNWNVAPSNHDTKEFLLIKERIETILSEYSFIYDYEKDEKELQHFIKNNIANATTTSKLKIDKNNFIPIYLRWLEIVKPNINVKWDELKEANILTTKDFIEIHLANEVSLNTLVLKEKITWGQRVVRFEISGGNDLKKFDPIVSGTTIGHKRILQFPTQKLKYLRIQFTQYKAIPIMGDTEGYLAP